jgi:hypothetical protein
MFRHQICHPQGACFVTLPKHLSTITALVKIMYVHGRHNSSINTQIVYTATIQTSCNDNHFIALDNFNVLKILLILTRAAVVLT